MTKDLNDNFPKNLDDAIEILKFVYADDLQEIKDVSEDEFSTIAHHNLGAYIRNSWQLWWQENHGYEQWSKEKPKLNAWFNSIGIYHADDMSTIILDCLHKNLNNKPYEIDKQAKHYIKYWKKEGFKNGNPFTKK